MLMRGFVLWLGLVVLYEQPCTTTAQDDGDGGDDGLIATTCELDNDTCEDCIEQGCGWVDLPAGSSQRCMKDCSFIADIELLQHGPGVRVALCGRGRRRGQASIVWRTE
jgi:hypothetical protein